MILSTTHWAEPVSCLKCKFQTVPDKQPSNSISANKPQTKDELIEDRSLLLVKLKKVCFDN